MNDYTRELRRKELLAHFDKRFADDLKIARERCSFVAVSEDIQEDARGKLTATVTLTCASGEKVSNSRALYEYRQRSASVPQEGWHCYLDWRD
ncbi:hypothetical protein PCA31118_05395 [Pandoraea captiosa]|uniref:Uncharacterized protein n=1 Tax=Pandoraea captiosa TaxID=2508302 RepID=A0A5E5AWJ3_9BURK|nr:hypothetical protein [Pandoraea captiosa]VVE77105.1 hypothetical protein PCA31118_05395 [Pandoraea captiosa]